MTKQATADASFALTTFVAATGRHAGRALLARDEVFAQDECDRILAAAKLARRAARDAGERLPSSVRQAERLSVQIWGEIDDRRYGR
jgi:hypothetical protein